MYKRFTKMDTSEIFTKDSNVKGTGGPHIKVRETSVALALIVPAPYTVH